MSDSEIDHLVEVAEAANRERHITGALVVAGGVFFQIIEGPPLAIDGLFSKIRADGRHTDVTCLDERIDREIRLFPDWAMRRVGQTSGAATSKIEALVQELSAANVERRQSLTDEIATLMRSALRAA